MADYMMIETSRGELPEALVERHNGEIGFGRRNIDPR